MPTRRIVIGLNSGTSADGVDAAACEITGRGLAMRVRLLGFVHRPYSDVLQSRLLAIMAPAATRTEELCCLDVEVGHAFADAAAAVVRKLGLRRTDLIGSHGQTICHLPPSSPLPLRERAGVRVGKPRAFGTCQIGDASIIAARAICPVIHHFRQSDMAVGGQGAPLVPWTDYVLFGHSRKNRIIQNIGGIANLTWLPAGGSVNNVRAFDTGPGGMVIDGLVRRFTRGRESFDRGGRRARRGRPHPAIIRHLLEHPFLYRMFPKSCGREQFGDAWLADLLKRFGRLRRSPDDWIATATFFTAFSIHMAYLTLSIATDRPYPPADEIILCGGGDRNRTLLDDLRRCVTLNGRFAVRFSVMEEHGIPSQAKESVSFAMLAAACADRVPANLPSVTGARQRVVLGQICDPRARR
ncbi:MAG TPA: anhydro-N-acetylmuramic acid kinase [Phycisphaerae bacterium]|nr:anhydro-N-acetylmuramic acid kinase [Phycisphaerae bacterium]